MGARAKTRAKSQTTRMPFAEPHKLASSRGGPLLYDRDILFGFSKLHIKATLASFNPKSIGLKISRGDEFNIHK